MRRFPEVVLNYFSTDFCVSHLNFHLRDVIGRSDRHNARRAPARAVRRVASGLEDCSGGCVLQASVSAGEPGSLRKPGTRHASDEIGLDALDF